MKIKLIIIVLFCLFCSLLSSILWEIKLDGTGDFTTIQEGINASVDADTVLVYPGTYYENIIYNGKNITVASLELTTSDPSYIPLTVINGQQQESCVRVWDQEISAKIQGITLTNGWGSQAWNKAGGGIYVKGEYQSPTYFSIKNCRITKNYAETGGGIYSFRGNITLSGVSIHDNYAYINGGGIHVNDTVLNFDANNRCNIYDNLAATGLELYSFRCQTNHVIVDTFTVIEPTRYFANQYELISCPNPPYSFDILNYTMEPVNHDLYVSPYGDDANSGLSLTEPMKTIVLAIRKVASDSLNPKTVHLAAGIYSKSLNDQFFAFGGKDYVKIIGDSKTTTIIDGENNQYCLFNMGCSDNSVLKNMTFQNITSEYCTLYMHDSNNTLIENIIIQYHSGTDGSAFGASPTERIYFKNVDILNCFTDQFVTAAFFYELDYLDMENCIISNNTCSGSGPDPQFCAGIGTTTYAGCEIIIKNSKFINNLLDSGGFSNAAALALGTLNGESGDFTITNCLFSNNQCAGTANKIVALDGSGNVTINNTTFVDNTGNYTLTILRNPIEFHNNIMRNNCNYEIFLPDNSPWGNTSTLNISHCNIQGGQNAIYNQNNANIVNWGDGNIDVDPLFLLSGDDPYQPTEQSPCIDAGTPDTTGLFIPSWDLLHNQRVWDGDEDGVATIDMGCYEYGAPQYVDIVEHEIPNSSFDNTNLLNYPNPFNPETTISFNLSESGKVKLSIYNIKGQKVKTLMDCTTAPGSYDCNWYGKDGQGKSVSSGQYIVKLQYNSKETATKIMLLK
ncbi:MAG: FlgD immunoglobulin-like domain containing protein [Candidatus Tenebribacter mawsonii]|nr:FlgD immunoglobulin-like domain containing protein [Candidatus Tenebribacter mawsonii]